MSRTIATVSPYTYAIDLGKHASLSLIDPGFAPNFSIATDVAVLAAFIVLACLRFCGSRGRRGTRHSSTCWRRRGVVRKTHRSPCPRHGRHSPLAVRRAISLVLKTSLRASAPVSACRRPIISVGGLAAWLERPRADTMDTRAASESGSW